LITFDSGLRQKLVRIAMPLIEQNLQPTPYHREVKEYLRREEPELWKWFSSAQAKAEYTESLRLALLKSTYRLDAEGHAELVQAAEEVKGKLGLTIPLTLYQSQQSSHLNAALYYIPGEGHVVLSGPILSLLTPLELKAVIGHELAHYHLWQQEDGAFLVADRILQAISDHPQAKPSHCQTARRYCLHTEIFADRGSLVATENLEAVIAGLIKTQTGLQTVSGASYLKQAEEVFARSKVKSEEVSHPEAFIRARALRLWSEGAVNVAAEVNGMLEGAGALDELDLPGQLRLCDLTGRFLKQLLRPNWFQTDATLAHAKMFFNDFKPAREDDLELISALQFGDSKVNDYFASLLLDFCVVDPELDDLPLAAGIKWSRKLKIEEQFEKLLTKELKVKARDVKKLKNDATEILQKAEAQS
jgi:hypothetical protein